MAAPKSDSARLAEDTARGNGLKRGGPLEAVLGEPTHPALSNVTCEVSDGHVTLVGEVPTFYLKQLAQEAAVRIRGIRSIDNKVKVVHAPVGGLP